MMVAQYPQPRALLDGKSVVITAAAGVGIGFAAARRAVEEGARVLMSDSHGRRLEEAAARIADELACQRPATFVCDVTAQDQIDALHAAALREFGSVDVLINNAGIGGEVEVVGMTDHQWNQVLDVSLGSVFRMTRAFLPAMYERGAGTIVNNASVLGWRAQKGQAHYAAAKAGVMAFTRCSALEAAEHGVRINAVAPSFANHPFLTKSLGGEMLERLKSLEAFGRGAEPWEVANIMMFLASDLSGYMTGEVISVSSQRA